MNEIYQKDLEEMRSRHKAELEELDQENSELKKELEKLQEENDGIKSNSLLNENDLRSKNLELEEKIATLESTINSLK